MARRRRYVGLLREVRALEFWRMHVMERVKIREIARSSGFSEDTVARDIELAYQVLRRSARDFYA